MRWHRNKDGDIRIKSGFLFFPKFIRGEWRWLEFAKWSQKCWVGSTTGTVYWDNLAWID